MNIFTIIYESIQFTLTQDLKMSAIISCVIVAFYLWTSLYMLYKRKMKQLLNSFRGNLLVQKYKYCMGL